MNVSQVTNDILNNPRFEGAIDSISWLTDWIDVGFGMAITLVAFLIILVAMFKNVLAAAYCAYPKFWGAVYDAHQNKRNNQNTSVFTQMIDMFQGVGSSRGGSINGGTIGNIILGIIPDIKSMTDFSDETISAKTYFARAIPQMLVCVILGAFIYNGTYRDVAARVVDFGSTMIKRTLLSFDPIAAFDDFTGSAGRPVFATDDAVLMADKRVNKLATTTYTAIIGTYKDITTADQKRVLADNCESAARSVLGKLSSNATFPADLLQDESFEMSLSIAWRSAALDTSSMTGLVQQNPTVYQFADCMSLESIGIPTNEVHEAYTYLVAVMQFTKVDVAASGQGYSDLVLELGSMTSANISYNVGKNTTHAYFNSNPGTVQVTNSSGAVVGTVTFVREGTSTKITFDAAQGVDVRPNATYRLGNGVKLYVPTSDGSTVVYTISGITFGNSENTGKLTSASGEAGYYPTSLDAAGSSVNNPAQANNATQVPESSD